jgi:hypothetical protein
MMYCYQVITSEVMTTLKPQSTFISGYPPSFYCYIVYCVGDLRIIINKLGPKRSSLAKLFNYLLQTCLEENSGYVKISCFIFVPT